MSNASAAPATSSLLPVLGELCSGVGKLVYDPTSNEQIVCAGKSCAKTFITTGVHASDSLCDWLGASVFAMFT
ncbi:hypothetical protein MUBE_01700 [Mycobacterium uberis]|uniref:Uncharacterized protein n=1 Tax=Mycobacterium uberis TaxID=2162698 RepID=A0A3E1HLD5_9MYCO|nr:hypothetical protein [Mycobacterium uberis]RFD27320.1 hypothetical protein MUBE_01700 [Mycobacterium uberis]